MFFKKKLTCILFSLATGVAYANLNSPFMQCSVFNDHCNNPFNVEYLYYSIPALSSLSPHPTANPDIPILLRANTTPFTNAISKVTLLNSGLYVGTEANYSMHLNAADYLFMQNPKLYAMGDRFQVMGMGVNFADNNDPGGKLYAGYRLNDHFAFEERYTRFTLGDIHQMTDVQYNNYSHAPKSNAYEAIARQSFSLTPHLSLLAKEGEALISTDLRAENGDLMSNGASDHHNLLRPVVGVGTGYTLSDNMTADFFYSYLLETSAIHAQMISTGLTYYLR